MKNRWNWHFILRPQCIRNLNQLHFEDTQKLNKSSTYISLFPRSHFSASPIISRLCGTDVEEFDSGGCFCFPAGPRGQVQWGPKADVELPSSLQISSGHGPLIRHHTHLRGSMELVHKVKAKKCQECTVFRITSFARNTKRNKKLMKAIKVAIWGSSLG